MSWIDDIAGERAAQDAKWGPQRNKPDWAGSPWELHHDADYAKYLTDRAAKAGKCSWSLILFEEVEEAIEEAEKGDMDALRTELVQVAAVCTQWIGDIDQRAHR